MRFYWLFALFLVSCSIPHQVCFGDQCFNVDLAVTSEEHARGLMFREYLAPNAGMLFVFSEGVYQFWMKNTLIPLDIIWLDNDEKIVFLAKNLQPCKEDSCPAIDPGLNASFVLEINAGLTERLELKVGDQAHFSSVFLPFSP